MVMAGGGEQASLLITSAAKTKKNVIFPDAKESLQPIEIWLNPKPSDC
jgi:hypothetical protein